MNNIINSFEKIEPSQQRLDKILKNIYEKSSTTSSDIIALPRKQKRFLRYSFSIMACLIVAIVGVIVKFSSDDSQNIPINDDKAYQIENASRNIIVGKSNSIDSTDIESTTNHTVNGFNLTHDAMTLEELETFKNNKSLPTTDDKNEFTIDYGEEYEQENDLFKKTYSTINRHDSSGEILWSVTFKNFSAYNYIEYDGYIVIYGQESVYSSEDRTNASIALLSKNDGKLLWHKKLSTQYKYEYITDIVINGDKIMVFMLGVPDTLVVMEFDLFGNGKLLAQNSLKHLNSDNDVFFIKDVFKLKQNYLALIYYNGSQILAKIDANGKITNFFTYSSNDLDYIINDIIEFENRLYISTHTVKKEKNSTNMMYGFRNSIDKIDTTQNIEIINKELTESLRENVNSALLICDLESGVPETFYSVNSSISSDFEVEENGNLTWVVGDIVDSLYSPYTSSYVVSVSCRKFNYSFNSKNQLDDCYKTDEVITFGECLYDSYNKKACK